MLIWLALIMRLVNLKIIIKSFFGRSPKRKFSIDKNRSADILKVKDVIAKTDTNVQCYSYVVDCFFFFKERKPKSVKKYVFEKCNSDENLTKLCMKSSF